VLRGTRAGETIYGLDGADSLAGRKGADVLHAGKGRDVLDGGRGADELHGEKGRGDVMTGGKGRDVFVVKEGNLRDFVTDWQDGRDRVRVDVEGKGFADLYIVQRGDDARVVYGSARDALILKGVDVDDLGREDFLFA